MLYVLSTNKITNTQVSSKTVCLSVFLSPPLTLYWPYMYCIVLCVRGCLSLQHYQYNDHFFRTLKYKDIPVWFYKKLRYSCQVKDLGQGLKVIVNVTIVAILFKTHQWSVLFNDIQHNLIEVRGQTCYHETWKWNVSLTSTFSFFISKIEIDYQ